jgi:hypothetical protein
MHMWARPRIWHRGLGRHQCIQSVVDASLARNMKQRICAVELTLSSARESPTRCSRHSICVAASGRYQVKTLLQAVMYFEKVFEVARSVGDAAVLDAARYNLGVAAAAAAKDAYFATVDADLGRLLNWKSLRVPFAEAA